MVKKYSKKYEWKQEEINLLRILWFYNKPSEVYKKKNFLTLSLTQLSTKQRKKSLKETKWS